MDDGILTTKENMWIPLKSNQSRARKHQTPIKVRQFLDLDGYDERFINNFSKIAKPLTVWPPNRKKSNWEHKQEATLQKVETYIV